MSNLTGKSVVVVGGTSGIGLAVATGAQAEGARVIVIGSDKEKSLAVAKEYGFAESKAADVTNEASITAALSDIPHVDHLVLLAGSFVFGTVKDAEVSYLKRAFEERIWGTIYSLKALGDRLAQDASVTLISGVLADRPVAGTAILAAASSAMESFARGLAIEQAPRRFNAVSPGTTDTPLLTRTLGDAKAGYVASVTEKLPLHRLAQAEQVADAVLFLMKNNVMNGETIHVDGGQRLV